MAQARSRAAGVQSSPPAQLAELEAENGRLRAEIVRVEAENGRLREQLAAAGKPAGPGRPVEPSFTFSEGQRDELERTGRTVSPFTGERYVGTPDNARKASAEEFAKAKPAADRKK